MGRILLLGVGEALGSVLALEEAWGREHSVEVADSLRDALASIDDPGVVDLVLIGPGVPDPVRTLQRIGMLDGDVTAAILHQPDETDRLANALMFAPFMPDDVVCRSLVPPPDQSELAEWAGRSEKRRRQQLRIAEANRQLAHAEPPALQRGEYLDRLLDYAPIGICALDASLSIVSWNQAAERLFGRPERAVLGTALVQLLKPVEPADLSMALSRGTEGQPLLVVEPVRDDDEERRQLEVIATPARTPHGSPGTLVLFIDITDRVRAEEERERVLEIQAELLERESEARTAAEEALRWRDDFLSVAAHELKTPLTSIKGFVQLVERWLMRDPPEITRARERLPDLGRQLQRYERLVNDLLDVSRMEHGRLALSAAPMDLADLAAVVLRRFEHAEERNERHELVLDVEGPVEGLWDPDRLEQVLVNLISNALRFSPDGGTVTVAVRALEGGAELVVSDSGLGIPPEELGTLFQPVARASTGSGILGSGLGLYISAQIVELHGGTIEVESREGAGSAFTVKLPPRVPTAALSAPGG